MSAKSQYTFDKGAKGISSRGKVVYIPDQVASAPEAFTDVFFPVVQVSTGYKRRAKLRIDSGWSVYKHCVAVDIF